MVQPSTGPEAGTYSKRTPLFDLHREFGPDVAHLNLHKTFCIPHGGGEYWRRADRVSANT